MRELLDQLIETEEEIILSFDYITPRELQELFELGARAELDGDRQLVYIFPPECG